MIKQNQSEVGNIDFKIEPNKAKKSFISYCFWHTSTVQKKWGFLQNADVKMVHTVSWKNEN